MANLQENNNTAKASIVLQAPSSPAIFKTFSGLAFEYPKTTAPRGEKTPAFSAREKTRVYKDFHGWTAETNVKVSGKCWAITTMKHINGTIATHCQVVQEMEGGAYSFMILGGNPSESFYLNETKAKRATEKVIKEIHFKSLADFDAMQEAGDLTTREDEYKIKVGQILFTHGFENEDRRVIYDIEEGRFGTRFKTALLSGEGFKIDTHVEDFSDKFGIGVYYKKGDTLPDEKIPDLLIQCHESEQGRKALEEAQALINKQQADAKAEYLSQFKKADRRKTTSIIKREIMRRWPDVQDLSVKTDVFSMGDSMDVRYKAPNEIKELEAFINSFQYGRFDMMNDLYENNPDQQEIIIDGYILQQYKYCFTRFDGVCEVKQVAAPARADGITITENEAKDGIEITFPAKPCPEVLESLKDNGFRWSMRKKIWYAKRSPETKDFANTLKG